MGEGRTVSPAEQEIQKSLGKLVEAKFNERPLGEVLDTLSKMVGVNIHLDPQGLAAEGLTTDAPVTLNLSQPISLRSALNLLLENKGLSYVIQNEVLLITSAAEPRPATPTPRSTTWPTWSCRFRTSCRATTSACRRPCAKA